MPDAAPPCVEPPPPHPTTYQTLVIHYLHHQQYDSRGCPRAPGHRPTIRELARTTELSRRLCCKHRLSYEATFRRLSPRRPRHSHQVAPFATPDRPPTPCKSPEPMA